MKIVYRICNKCGTTTDHLGEIDWIDWDRNQERFTIDLCKACTQEVFAKSELILPRLREICKRDIQQNEDKMPGKNRYFRIVSKKASPDKQNPMPEVRDNEPFSQTYEEAFNGCKHLVTENPDVECVSLIQTDAKLVGTFVRDGEKARMIAANSNGVQTLPPKDFYGMEIGSAIAYYFSEIEKLEPEFRKADADTSDADRKQQGLTAPIVLMYCNKCLSLLQFGLSVKLITEKEWRVGYDKLDAAFKLVSGK